MVNSKIPSLAICFYATFMLASCNQSVAVSDEQLHQKALSLPLKDRYDLYLKVYNSRIPRNPLLAPDVASLGKTAREYAIRMAQSSNGSDFGAALSVISSFNNGCTGRERIILMNAVKHNSTEQSQKIALEDSVNSVCSKSPPKGWK